MQPGEHERGRLLAEGEAALAGGEWARARDLLLPVAGEDPAAWEAVGWAAWWLADEELTFAARERAYNLYRSAGEPLGSGRLAIWIAADHREYRGEATIGRGWLERARRLLDPLPEAPEHGWLLLTEADFALNLEGELETVLALAGRAREIGGRHSVPDLETVGLGLEGLALVGRGEVEAGMRRLEEGAAIATAEDLNLPLSAGWALCCTLSACDGIGDFDRAQQWCEAINRFTGRWGGRQLVGVCRTSYGRVLANRGRWREAEDELRAAIEDIERSRPGMGGRGLARLAELRARQGRVEEAAELFERAGPAGLAGLGELALAAGDADAALDAAERCLRRLPAAALLERLPGLELRARALVALGRLEEAGREADAIAAAAASIGTPYARGRAALVRAELAAAGADHDGSRRACEDAIDCFAAAAAVYESARARVRLADALRALGRGERAARELGAAREAFERLGAGADLAALGPGAASAVAAGGGADRAALTAREIEVLRLVAAGRSDAEIAAELVVSPHTVHRHVANVRTKLGASSRAAAVACASREGLL